MSVIVRVRVRGADVDLFGEKGRICVGSIRPSAWGTYRWLLNGPGGGERVYFTQKATDNWREVLAEHLEDLWGHSRIRVVGDNLTPGPEPRRPGLVGP